MNKVRIKGLIILLFGLAAQFLPTTSPVKSAQKKPLIFERLLLPMLRDCGLDKTRTNARNPI
jgi:hypothetical protein